MSSFFISEEIKSRINLNNISNNSLIIDNILSLSVFEDKIEVKFNITDMNMLNKNIKVEALIVGEKTINFKNNLIFEFQSYNFDLDLKLSICTILIDKETFWENMI